MASRRKKYLFTIIISLIAITAGGFFLYRMTAQKGSNQKFRMIRVERGEISLIVTATGTITPVTTVLVGSQVSGMIKALYADFNSRVKEGEVIVQIDPAIFEAQVEQGRASLLNAQASLLNAQANLQSAHANLTKAEVSVLDTKRTLDRNRELAEKKMVAQATLDTAQANYDTAVAQREVSKAQVESSKAQVESAKAQVEQARAGLKLAETNLRYTTIRSPVSGVVISRNVDVGQTVAASLQAPTLFTIAKDLTRMQVDTNVSEADIGRIEKGQETTFTVDAYPERTFRGRVSEIRNAPITVQNVVTYVVVVEVENRELRLKPGMTANVSILLVHQEGVLKIPNAALRFRPEMAKKEETVKKGGEGSKSPGQQSKEGSQSPDRQSKGGSQSPGRQMVERLVSELNLTQDQQSRVEMILQSSRPEIQEIREKSKPEEARIRIQSLIRQKIAGLLTEEQKKKLSELNQSSQGRQRQPGRVWILSPEGKPLPVSIVLGITDGTFSEVVSGELREGMEVIVEETGIKKGQSQSKTSQPSMRGLSK
ncbi:MAG: efflux RND transporter periplasmic adaptor subunit [Thermodesulfobacteriota bacterium]|nr:efflux RND transporter periplasmic adaptor subunit [Thermodesulfobacteriota bacterium]